MKLVIVASLLFCMNAFAEVYVSSDEVKNCQLANSWNILIGEKTMKSLKNKGYYVVPSVSLLEIFRDPTLLHLSAGTTYGDSNVKASFKCGSWNQTDSEDIIKISILKLDILNELSINVGSASGELISCRSYSIEQAEQELDKALSKIVNHLPDCKDLRL